MYHTQVPQGRRGDPDDEHRSDVSDGRERQTVHGDAKKAGFGIKHGHGYDLTGYQLMKGGQYNIDQEASRMTIKWQDHDPRIRGGTKEFQSDGLRLANGTKLEVDVVVLVIGCESNATTIQKLFGPEVAKIDIGSMRHE
ncbi:hypothetical protein LY78DRAFT_680598 [Colletotrichum sublineola]|nr:hypothetical protein LY78DRAFT_680598 [Colletotrichum sublineola]